MSSLEKAARAVAVRRGWDWELCTPGTHTELTEDARAVLLAVREPDKAMIKAGGIASSVRNDDNDYIEANERNAASAFTAMIDAIPEE
jgi:hypothetical protein